MSRLRELRFRWNLGIHQQPNFARPDHLRDARNVWAPEGEVRLRPGLVNIPGDFALLGEGSFTTNLVEDWRNLAFDLNRDWFQCVWYDDSAGTYTDLYISGVSATVPLHSLDAKDYLYFGIKPQAGPAPERIYDVFSLQASLKTTVPTTGLRGLLQYWNGSTWKAIPVALPALTELESTPTVPAYFPMCFKAPSDWALSTVNGTELYWVRLYISKDVAVGGNSYWDFEDGGFTQIHGIDQPGLDDIASLYGVRIIDTPRGKMSFLVVGFSADADNPNTSQLWLIMKQGLSGTSYVTENYGTLKASLFHEIEVGFSGNDAGSFGPPARFSYAPALGRVFISTGFRVFEIDVQTEKYYHDSEISSETWTEKDLSNTTRQVLDHASLLLPEDKDWMVNSDTSPYYHQYLAQETESPEAAAVEYFDDRLFFCGFRSEPRRVQWSLAGIAYRVFPQLAYTYVPGPPEPLLGFLTIGESLYVYDTKSIWKLSFVELDAFEIPHYEAKQVVAGVGPIAPSSIVSYPGGILFLSYDGLVSYDGVRARKVAEHVYHGQTTDRLAKLWSRINWGLSRAYSTAVNWRDRGHYLLTLPLDDNRRCNTVLVWDYENDSFWLWEMDIVGLFEFQGTGGAQEIGVLDRTYRPARLVDRHSDFTQAISASVTPHRIQLQGAGTAKLREIELITDTDKGRVQVQLGVQGSTTKKTLIYDPYDAVGATSLGSLSFIVPREKAIKKGVAKTGENFDLELSTADTDEDFLIREVLLRWFSVGTR